MREKNFRTENAIGNEADQLLSTALVRATARQLSVIELVEITTRLEAMQRNMAIELYKTWIAFNTDHPSIHAIYFNYAVCLTDTEDVAGAINALRETIRLKPDFGPAVINLGNLLERSGQVGQAVETWLSLVNTLSAVTPDALNYKNLTLKQTGRVLEISNKDEAAEDVLRQCLELNPAQPDVMQHWLALRQRQCKWPAVVGSDRLAANNLRAAISPLSAAYCADDPIRQLAVAYNYARRTIGLPAEQCAPRLEAIQPANQTRRLRIGYVSSDLREHAVGFAMTDVFETHDRTKVETFAYYCGIDTSDSTQQRTIRAAEHWRVLNGLDDAQAAQLIRSDGIDILIDLNGYTKDARTKVFAMRPAPIAVNWFGFPGTMGSPYHQYLIADEQVIPSGHEIYYTEKILRLPCYQPNDRKRPVAPTPLRSEEGLPDAAFVFCCLNGMQKLTESCFADWMTILRDVSGSVLWLLSGTPDANERLRAAAERHGVAATRLIFADKRRNPEHLARIALADLFLDTFPYGAHTTASDALWVGLPILTMHGRSFASRVCGSLAIAAGIPELVCQTRENYIKQAIALASDEPRLKSIRERLRADRHQSMLFDTPLLVRSLEALYHQINNDRLAGMLPQPDLRNLDLYHEISSESDMETVGPLETPAYLDHYRKRIADINSVYPVSADERLWAPRPGSRNDVAR